MNERRPLTVERIRELIAIALLLTLTWVVAGLYATSEFYRRALAGGASSIDWKATLAVQFITAMNWAFFTPFIVKLAEMFPVRRPHVLRNLVVLAGSVPMIAFLRAVEGSFMIRVAEREPITMDFVKLSLEIRFHRYIYLTAIIILAAHLYFFSREAGLRARAAFAAEALLARTEMQELRASLQPEFLFRTMERAKSMLRRNRDAADRLIVGLADLLRRRLAFGSDNIPVEEELEFLDRYVALNAEATDLAQALYVDMDDDVLGRRIPALLLQPLVEHAVAHMAGDGFVEVTGRVDGTTLRIQVRHEGDADFEWSGLARMRTTLTKAFGEKQALALRREGRFVVAELSIPAELPEGSARRESGRYRAVAGA